MNPKTLCDQNTKEQLAEKVVELEAENEELQKKLDTYGALGYRMSKSIMADLEDGDD